MILSLKLMLISARKYAGHETVQKVFNELMSPASQRFFGIKLGITSGF